ncbi:unnamed protein product [Lota lota]
MAATLAYGLRPSDETMSERFGPDLHAVPPGTETSTLSPQGDSRLQQDPCRTKRRVKRLGGEGRSSSCKHQQPPPPPPGKVGPEKEAPPVLFLISVAATVSCLSPAPPAQRPGINTPGSPRCYNERPDKPREACSTSQWDEKSPELADADRRHGRERYGYCAHVGQATESESREREKRATELPRTDVDYIEGRDYRGMQTESRDDGSIRKGLLRNTRLSDPAAGPGGYFRGPPPRRYGGRSGDPGSDPARRVGTRLSRFCSQRVSRVLARALVADKTCCSALRGSPCHGLNQTAPLGAPPMGKRCRYEAPYMTVSQRGPFPEEEQRLRSAEDDEDEDDDGAA